MVEGTVTSKSLSTTRLAVLSVEMTRIFQSFRSYFLMKSLEVARTRQMMTNKNAFISNNI